MEPKGSYAIVGLFVMLLGVAFVASILWLAGEGKGPTATYEVYMHESVSGLPPDAPVKYRGVDVGRVAKIALRPNDPETVQLTLEIDPAAPVREDTRAQLEFQGLTGLLFVNLVGGSKESPPLKKRPGEPHPIIEATPSLLLRFDTGMTNLMVSVTATSDKLAQVIDRMDQDALNRTLHHLEQLSGVLAARSAQIDRATVDAARLFHNAAAASDRLPGVVANLDTLVTEWSSISASLQDLATTGGSEVARTTAQVSGDAQALATDLKRLVARLDRVLAGLEDDPASVLYGRAARRSGPGE